MGNATRAAAIGAALSFALASFPSLAAADITTVARCQKRIASAGADYAKRVIVTTVKCTEEVAECQAQCEAGVYGPSCEESGPPCCDPDDRFSNPVFEACMNEADDFCAEQEAKIVKYEATKQKKIIDGCDELTPSELCGASGTGLNFALVNAGCLALDPSYTCTLTNLINCVGGPLQRQLIDQISGLLSPRASEAVKAANLQAVFPDLPVAYRVKEDLPAAGRADIWSITGQAGDKVVVRVKTRNDAGGFSTIQPDIVLLGTDGTTPVADTTINDVPCSVPNTCGSTCPQLQRVLPFTGTFYASVRANGANGCAGGKYRLIITTRAGTPPTLVQDDVTP